MTHTEVLNSDQPIQGVDLAFRCHDCPKPATRVWPTVSDKPFFYCETCLEKAKDRLLVALGSQAYIQT